MEIWEDMIREGRGIGGAGRHMGNQEAMDRKAGGTKQLGRGRA